MENDYDIEFSDFLATGAVGAVLSLVLELIPAKASSATKKAVTVLMSLLLGGVYVWLRRSPYFPAAMTVLMSASTVYALFLKKDSVKGPVDLAGAAKGVVENVKDL